MGWHTAAAAVVVTAVGKTAAPVGRALACCTAAA